MAHHSFTRFTFRVFLYFGPSYVVIGLLPKTHVTKVISIIEDIDIVGWKHAEIVAQICKPEFCYNVFGKRYGLFNDGVNKLFGIVTLAIIAIFMFSYNYALIYPAIITILAISYDVIIKKRQEYADFKE